MGRTNCCAYVDVGGHTPVGLAAVAKISISIDDALLAAVKREAQGNVSAFVAAAIEHRLSNNALGRYLDELEKEYGAPPAEAVARAKAAMDELRAAEREWERQQGAKPAKATKPKRKSA